MACQKPELFQSLTTIGTPFLKGLELKKRESRLLKLARKVTPGEASIRVPLKKLVGAAGNLASMGAWLVDGTVLNKANMDNSVINLMAQDGIDDIPLKILPSLADRIYAEDDYTGPYDFEDKLHSIELPMMLVSGSADRIAPPEAVFRSVGRVASPMFSTERWGCALETQSIMDILISWLGAMHHERFFHWCSVLWRKKTVSVRSV